MMRSCKYCNESLGSRKGGKFVDQLRYHYTPLRGRFLLCSIKCVMSLMRFMLTTHVHSCTSVVLFINL